LNLGPGSWTRVEFDRAIKKDRATTKDRWLNVKNEMRIAIVQDQESGVADLRRRSLGIPL
jgi:hypothetical protein